jgi:hypothetical protein
MLNLFSDITQKPINLPHMSSQEDLKAKSKGMAMRDRWINKKGYHADIKAVRSELPDILTLKDYLQKKPAGDRYLPNKKSP